jgi:hypothetical protein
MTEKTLQEKTEKLGGTVEYPACIIRLPQALRIKTKSEALDLLDILSNSLDCGENTYQINECTAYTALRAAIKKGLA